MGPLEPLRVTLLEQAIVVGAIRNDCLEYMTKDSSYISVARQWEWFAYRAPYHTYLYGVDGAPIGYGTRSNDGHLSGGLISTFRGRGYGKQLFGHLCSLGSPTKLEVFCDNMRAIKTYLKLGFEHTAAYQNPATFKWVSIMEKK